jgi:hypothetical protein
MHMYMYGYVYVLKITTCYDHLTSYKVGWLTCVQMVGLFAIYTYIGSTCVLYL